jgi:iron-sulfur cluster assembly protein
MFEVTEKASDMIKDFLKDKDEFPPIRLMLSQGGWSGPSLGLALDELKDDDKSFDDRGLTFVMEKDFYEKIKPVKVDYADTPMGAGFNISSNMQKPESSCGSSCSSC